MDLGTWEVAEVCVVGRFKEDSWAERKPDCCLVGGKATVGYGQVVWGLHLENIKNVANLKWRFGSLYFFWGEFC